MKNNAKSKRNPYSNKIILHDMKRLFKLHHACLLIHVYTLTYSYKKLQTFLKHKKREEFCEGHPHRMSIGINIRAYDNFQSHYAWLRDYK